MEFDSLPEEYDFYNLYSWEFGFGIRYGSCRKNPSSSKIAQDIVCSCAVRGPRHLNSNSLSCTCQAMIRLHRTIDRGWFIHEFKTQHTHGLAVTAAEKMHWASHRSIDPHTIQLVKNLRDNNVGLRKVLSVIGGFFGAMENLPFNKRSLKTICAGISRNHCDDDVKKTCELFSQLKREDPNFIDNVLADKDGNIRARMWTNGKSRMQYKSFGDAITFDTTYRTNQYEMPFGLFVGVNTHFQSIILGGVLMTNETVENFTWCHRIIYLWMSMRKILTILLPTHQCRAMEVAIIDVLPETAHRWCKWHVLRKAKECLGSLLTKNKVFQDQFHKICEYMITVDEFERAWAELIQDFNLEENAFLTQIYDVRHKWAKPLFAGIFCARMTSTQRSESANHMLKNFVPPGSPMNMFVGHYQKMLFDRDGEENFQEKECRVKSVVLSGGGLIEKHASRVYTRVMLQLFGVALFNTALYNAKTIFAGYLYSVTHVDASKRERWSRISYQVEVKEQGSLHCECRMYEHMGMLCCHAIRLRQIPEVHIMKRWTRSACIVLPEHLRMYQSGSPAMKSPIYRHTSLFRTAYDMVHLGDSNTVSYHVAMNTMLDAMPSLTETSKQKHGLGVEECDHADENERACRSPVPIIGHRKLSRCLSADMVAPPKKKSKGRPTSARFKPGHELSRPRHRFCSVCRGRGHFSDGFPTLGKIVKKPRKPPTCSNCGLSGHIRSNCK
ncbi:unnamed protein product [Alopecurus aequalis]